MKKHSLFYRTLIAAISGIGLALGLTLPANSLTRTEAEKVTMLVISLSPEIGPFAYDEEEADRWFDADAEMNGAIAAAGFSRDGWRQALNATFRGYLATIPANVFSTKLTDARDRLIDSTALSEEQKAEIGAMLEEKIAEIQLMRAEGAAYAEAVRPRSARLALAFDVGLGEED